MNLRISPGPSSIRLVTAAGILLALAPLPAGAVTTSIILEPGSGALNLGSSAAVNDGGTIDPDIAGKLVTSPVTGQGSILYVQTDGKAGQGTLSSPLLFTVTANSHLDNTGAIGDFQAGVLYLASADGTAGPVGHGLGVRAFTVNSTTGLRQSGPSPGIEGSKEVSGGSDPTSFTVRGNGAPHVDERVLFTINPTLSVVGQSISMVLTKFDGTGTSPGGLNGSEDIFDLVINRLSGSPLVFNSLKASSFGNWGTNIGTDAWKFDFSKITGLGPTDIVTSFSVRANDDNPSNPAGTAEHFLINGFTLTYNETPPVPDSGSTAGLLGLGLLGLLAVRHRRRH